MEYFKSVLYGIFIRSSSHFLIYIAHINIPGQDFVIFKKTVTFDIQITSLYIEA